MCRYIFTDPVALCKPVEWICDLVCKKGSYSLSNCPVWLIIPHHVFYLSPSYCTKLKHNVMDIRGRHFCVMQHNVTGCQVHAVEKAIRPLFTDWLTFYIIQTPILYVFITIDSVVLDADLPNLSQCIVYCNSLWNPKWWPKNGCDSSKSL